jgi:parvulin-like peptidyl-prolyl isomerase
MSTIKVKSTDEASQGPFVIICKTDFNPEVHEPFDDEARAALSGAVASGEIIPSAAELLDARDQLLARERELNAERDRLAAQAAANDTEAQRLADLAAAAAAAAAPAVPAEIAAMSKDQLQAALTEKGISFPAAANKADLVALLTA